MRWRCAASNEDVDEGARRPEGAVWQRTKIGTWGEKVALMDRGLYALQAGEQGSGALFEGGPEGDEMRGGLVSWADYVCARVLEEASGAELVQRGALVGKTRRM